MFMTKLRSTLNFTGGAWNSNTSFVQYFNKQLSTLKALGMQCNMIAAHRIRRTMQIMMLYRNLYGRQTPSQFLERLDWLIKANPKEKMLLLLGAAFFDWKSMRITEEDMKKVDEDLKPFFECKASELKYQDAEGEVWEKVLDINHLKVWRCPVTGTSLYKYKLYGTYSDIPANAFFNIQLDLEYRKKWDSHVVQLEKVEEDEETGTEVIYWATHFPLGMLYDRDYLFVRKYKVDVDQNIMTLSAKGVEHPQYPETKAFVRVGEYTSQMVIRPHTTFDANGFDYVMSYHDNPHLYVPNYIINKLTLSSLPAFLEDLHKATVNLVRSKEKIRDYRHSTKACEQPETMSQRIKSYNYTQQQSPV